MSFATKKGGDFSNPIRIVFQALVYLTRFTITSRKYKGAIIMKKFRLFTVVLLAIALLMTFPAQASATQGTIATAETHTHNLTFLKNMYLYYEDGASSHRKATQPAYLCTICNDVIAGEVSWTIESHSMGNFSYTGANYHSGNNHYVCYERSCIQCGYSESYWEHYSCPGNGACILPQSFGPVLMEK